MGWDGKEGVRVACGAKCGGQTEERKCGDVLQLILPRTEKRAIDLPLVRTQLLQIAAARSRLIPFPFTHHHRRSRCGYVRRVEGASVRMYALHPNS